MDSVVKKHRKLLETYILVWFEDYFDFCFSTRKGFMSSVNTGTILNFKKGNVTPFSQDRKKWGRFGETSLQTCNP